MVEAIQPPKRSRKILRRLQDPPQIINVARAIGWDRWRRFLVLADDYTLNALLDYYNLPEGDLRRDSPTFKRRLNHLRRWQREQWLWIVPIKLDFRGFYLPHEIEEIWEKKNYLVEHQDDVETLWWLGKKYWEVRKWHRKRKSPLTHHQYDVQESDAVNELLSWGVEEEEETSEVNDE